MVMVWSWRHTQALALSALLSYGRAAGHFGRDATQTFGGMIYVGVTWTLAINHTMTIAQMLVADFGQCPLACL